MHATVGAGYVRPVTSTDPDLVDLATALAQILGSADRPAAVDALTRLTGGASRETYAFVDADSGRHYILQRERGGVLRNERGMAAEAGVVERAAEAGVPVPRVVATNESHPSAGIGPSYFVTEAVEGATIARRILRDAEFAAARPLLAEQAGRALGHLHAADPAGLDHLEQTDELARWRVVIDELALVSPVFELAFRWLERHRPPGGDVALVHGDFRLGNLIIDERGLAAVLDWELAHLGDPMEDLGWLCTRAWRFGGPKPVAGVGEYEDLFAAYEATSGRSVDREVFGWWERLGTLKWGIMCGLQASAHRTGVVESLELLAIGSRIAEQEYDLAWSLAGDTVDRSAIGDLGLSVEAAPGSGQPDAAELTGALARFLSDTVAPAVGRGGIGFHVRVATNVASMLEREARAGDLQRNRHRARLDGLGVADDTDLAQRIRAGEFDADLTGLAALLALSTAERLAIVNPKWLA